MSLFFYQTQVAFYVVTFACLFVCFLEDQCVQVIKLAVDPLALILNKVCCFLQMRLRVSRRTLLLSSLYNSFTPK